MNKNFLFLGAFAILTLLLSGCVAHVGPDVMVEEEIPFDGPQGWMLTDVWIGGVFYPVFWTRDRTVIINNIGRYRGHHHGHFIRHRDRHHGGGGHQPRIRSRSPSRPSRQAPPSRRR